MAVCLSVRTTTSRDVLGQQRAGIFKRCVAEHEHTQHGHLPFAGGDHADGALGREHGLHADGDGLMGDHIVAAAEHSFAGLNDLLVADVDDLRLHVDVHLFGDALIGVRGEIRTTRRALCSRCPPRSVNAAEFLDLSVNEVEILKRGPDALLFGNVQLGVYLAVKADFHAALRAVPIVAFGEGPGIPVQTEVHVEKYTGS